MYPQKGFNCDEPVLFRKQKAKKTFITREEETLLGHKRMKDMLTLLLHSNATGDSKLKPLFVYLSEIPRFFIRNNVVKCKYCVMWMANKKA